MPPSIAAHLDTARVDVPRALRRHAPALVIVALALLLAAVVLRYGVGLG